MGPSLAGRADEGLLGSDDWPGVLVEEVGLVGGGRSRRGKCTALQSLTGNSLGPGSRVGSPTLARGDSSRAKSCSCAPTRTAEELSKPRSHIALPSSSIHCGEAWTVARASPCGVTCRPFSMASFAPGGEKRLLSTVSRRCHCGASPGRAGVDGGPCPASWTGPAPWTGKSAPCTGRSSP